MPKVFKTLTSIIIWALFISSCIFAFVPTLNWVVSVGLIGEPNPAMFKGWGFATAQGFLTVVAVKLRQMME